MVASHEEDYTANILWTAGCRGTQQLFNLMRDSLFVEEDDKSSRVEAYGLDLVSRQPHPVIDNVNCGIRRDSVSNSVTVGIDEFHMMDIVSLRNFDEIVSYQEKTHQFRAFFIRQRFSWAALSITPVLFQSLCRAIKIPMRIQELILYFGDRDREVEIIPPRFVHRPLSRPGISGAREYECMYVIRYFENNGRGTPQEPSTQWSMRQTAVYNRFQPNNDGSTWFFVAPSKEMQKLIDDYVANRLDLGGADPLELHWLLLHNTLLNWRRYVIDLSIEVDEHTAQIAGMSPDDQGPISLSDATTRQELMLLDEKLLNAALVAKATAEMVDSMRDSTMAASPDQPAAIFSAQTMFKEQRCDFQRYTVQLENLRIKLTNSSTLLSSFLDLGSGLALQNLARESRQENESMRVLSERMHDLTKKATRDAAAVKVLTILTLIYLPATVVCNFFSTSFVGSEIGSGHITVSSDWWILVVISVPLTAITLYIWYVWKSHQADGKLPEWWKMLPMHRPRGKFSQSSNVPQIVQGV